MTTSLSYIKFKWLSIVFLMFLLVTFAQKVTYAQSFDLGSWNTLNIKYTHNKKTSFFAEDQLRSLQFYNQFHYFEYKGGINYKLHKSVKLTLGAGNYQTYDEGANFKTPKLNNEFRLWPQLVFLQAFNSFTIEQRYRAEMRWTSNGYRNRFRYRFGLSYPFGKEMNGYKPFQLSVSNELFFTNKEPYFERNRSQIALNYKASKRTMIQLGYLHQFDYKINDETGRDFLVMGFYFEWFKTNRTKVDQDNELKDN